MTCLGFLLAIALAGEPARVARLDLPVPGHSPFLLHGTLPLPAGAPLCPPGRTVLYVESHDPARTLVPAQVEVVSRAPDGTPDVVEVLARVELGPEDRAGERSSYSILRGEECVPPAFEGAPAVAELLSRNARNLLLRAQDVFGNVYVADLCGPAKDASFGSLRLTKSGAWERELRLAAVLAPLPEPKGSGPALPHLMGVHAYVRTHAREELVELDLRLHGGLASGSRPPAKLEEPVGALYWRSLELLLPREWTALADVSDPFLGAPREQGRWRVIPLVKPFEDGRLHLLPPQAQFVRRLALVPVAAAARARDELRKDGLGFAAPGEGLWSWFAPGCARWFAQRAALPQMGFFASGSERGLGALRALEATREREYAQALESGKPRGWYTVANVMGWAHPWFLNTRSSYGNEGLALVEGAYAAAGASRESYLAFEHLHRMSVCRQSEALWTHEGDPAGYQAWLDAEGRIPFEFREAEGERLQAFRLPCQGGPPANEQVHEVARRGLRPAYDQGDWFEKEGSLPERNDNLLAWLPHGGEHKLRFTRNAKVLAWLGNDSLAKDDLLLAAELFHLAFHESPHAGARSARPATLFEAEQLARAHPHQGLDLGREFAYGVDSACTAYSLAPPAWRERNRAWLLRIAQLLSDAALPNGIVQRSANARVLGNQVYTVALTSDSLLLVHALRCLDASVLRGSDPAASAAAETLALRALVYLFWGPPFQRIASDWQPDPRRPSVFVQGPRFGFAVSKNDDYRTPPFADASAFGADYLPPDGLGGGIEGTHGLWALAWAREISEPEAGTGLQNRYLRRALEYGVPHADFGELARELEAQTREFSRDNSGNWAPFLAALQQLGVR